MRTELQQFRDYAFADIASWVLVGIGVAIIIGGCVLALRLKWLDRKRREK